MAPAHLRVSLMPNRAWKADATFPCDRPIWVCSTAAAATWASGADLTGRCAGASDVWSGCRPLGTLAARLAVADAWTRNLRISGWRGMSESGTEVGRVGLDEAAPAVRAGVPRQVGLFVTLGDLIGRRAVTVGAVGVPRLSAGRLRVLGLRRTLAERGGLPLAGTHCTSSSFRVQFGDLGR